MKEMHRNISKYLFVFVIVLIVAFIALALWIEAAVQTDIKRIENTVNLNGEKAALMVGESWIVEGVFSVQLTDIAEISGEQAKDDFNITADSEKKYYVVCFDYENINFPGYYVEKEFNENQMRLRVNAYVLDTEENMTAGCMTHYLDPFYYADASSKVTDNKFLLEIKNDDKNAFIEIIFKIPTKNELEIYEQNYLFPIA